MSTEIEIYAQANLTERWNYAQAMASAGDLVPKGMRTGGQPDAGKIFFTFETGSMLGLHPVAAIQGVNVIEGKPTLSPALMSAVVRRAGHLLRVRTEGSVKDLSLTATAELVRKDDPDHPFIVTWTIEKAARAGLLQVTDGAIRARSDRGAILPWEKYTESMLKARAIGEVCREGGTDALMGVAYMPEELGAEVNEQGELVAMPGTSEGAAPMRRPAPSAEDYKPIALAEMPAAAAIVEEAIYPDTDMDMVEIYKLGEIGTVIEARQAFLNARFNGHLDRPVEGKPLGQWLEDLAAMLGEIQENVDRQTGVVDDTNDAPVADHVVSEAR